MENVYKPIAKIIESYNKLNLSEITCDFIGMLNNHKRATLWRRCDYYEIRDYINWRARQKNDYCSVCDWNGDDGAVRTQHCKTCGMWYCQDCIGIFKSHKNHCTFCRYPEIPTDYSIGCLFPTNEIFIDLHVPQTSVIH